MDGYADEMEGFYPLRVPLVVSVAGKQSEDEVRSVIGRLRGLYDVVELNVSCPNVKGGMAAGTNPQLTALYTKTAKEEAGRKPVVVKLTPNVDGIATIALAAADAGADGVLAINTILGKYVNPHTLRPHLTNQTGGVSGHNIIDDGLRRVNEIASALDARGHRIAVGGVGGIRDAHDAKRYMAEGATYVQLGTCLFLDSPMEKKRFTEPNLETVEEKLTRFEREMYGNGTAI